MHFNIIQCSILWIIKLYSLLSWIHGNNFVALTMHQMSDVCCVRWFYSLATWNLQSSLPQ